MRAAFAIASPGGNMATRRLHRAEGRRVGLAALIIANGIPPGEGPALRQSRVSRRPDRACPTDKTLPAQRRRHGTPGTDLMNGRSRPTDRVRE